MNRSINRQGIRVVAVALVVASAGLSGCGVISAVKKVVHNVEANKATMGAFTNKIKSGEGATFEATYMTSGSSPATVVYAVEPSEGLAFSIKSSGTNNANNVDLIVNHSGEYSCTPPSTSTSGSSVPAADTKWTCEKLPKASVADYNNILDFYTPAHWVTFLGDAALAAGFAGDKVTSSTLTVGSFAMSCVDLVASGVNGTSTICTTAQDILGYVKVAQDSTSFEIKSYSASPAASLFQLPPGATVTTIPSAPTSTT